MPTSILATKLYLPPPRPRRVLRPRLIARLNEGRHHKLSLISAAAGFGKTTLVSEWAATCGRRAAWLSLDEGDNDPARFLTYLVAAVQTVAPHIGAGIITALRSPQPPSIESVLTTMLNDIATLTDAFVLVLDDYHILEAAPIDAALTFLLDHLPPQMHLVIATREDPHLPLARLRMRGQLTELRAADLRFTPSEAADFLNHGMGLNLSAQDIAALETRTEGWIAGLQLAAISMQGHQDTSGFIKSFTGSHRFVLDYLVQEVLQQQPEQVQAFLLHTSILERLCGPLCDAVVRSPSASGQSTLEQLERANLFIIPLDNERRWYRYHHLFGDLLRQRLQQSTVSSLEGQGIAEYHIRASQWYEDNGLEIEAFHHAAAAHDLNRATRLMEGKGLPLQFRGALVPILNWLKSLPAAVLDAHPSLWVTYASVLLATGQTTVIEQKLQAAEAAVQRVPPDEKTRDLIGRIAGTRATLALSQQQLDVIIAQSQRALEYLHPDNLPFRTSTIWKMGYAYQLQKNRAAAIQAYSEAIATSQASGNIVITLLASTGMGMVQESETQLLLAAKIYQDILQQVGDLSLPAATCESHLGLGRISYEWNNLDAAQQYGQKSLQLAPQLQNTDRSVACEVFLARLKLAQGDVMGAAALLAQVSQIAQQQHFIYQIPDIATLQVLTLLHQGHLAAAAHLAQTHDLPLSLARVLLAQGDTLAALAVLAPLREQVETKNWHDERLKVMVLQAIVHRAQGEKDTALRLLNDALALAEPGGFIRLFIDEGLPMAHLLAEAAAQGIISDYIKTLLATFDAEKQARPQSSPLHTASPLLIDPLSQRELEVLQLIAQGLSNHDISERLFLSLNTIKGHNQKIFGKLQVQRRTEAVARARELGLV